MIFGVGITGTNGKTTTTAWVAAALRALARSKGGGPVARATTVGFFLDDEEMVVDKTFAGFVDAMRVCAERGGTHAAVELTSEALARGFTRAWACQVGVFTNLTHDHLDAHGSAEHYLASKAQLFVTLPPGGTAVLNAADDTFELLREVIPTGVAVRSYAVPSRGVVRGVPDLVAGSVEVSWSGTRMSLVVGEGSDLAVGLPKTLHVRAIGEIYAENALAALLGAIAAGVPPALAAAALEAAAPPPGRFEVVHERPHVVIDYAHGPDALSRTVQTARTLTRGALTVVFGAGGARDTEKRAPMGEAARLADHVVLTTDNPRDEDPAEIARAIEDGLRGHASVRTELDRRRAITSAIDAANDGDVVLIAGKGHETEQVVGAETRRFSDVEVAKEACAARRGQ